MKDKLSKEQIKYLIDEIDSLKRSVQRKLKEELEKHKLYVPKGKYEIVLTKELTLFLDKGYYSKRDEVFVEVPVDLFIPNLKEEYNKKAKEIEAKIERAEDRFRAAEREIVLGDSKEAIKILEKLEKEFK